MDYTSNQHGCVTTFPVQLERGQAKECSGMGVFLSNLKNQSSTLCGLEMYNTCSARKGCFAMEGWVILIVIFQTWELLNINLTL